MTADRTFFGRTLLLRVYIEPHDGPNTISKVMHTGVVLVFEYIECSSGAINTLEYQY